MKATNNEVCCVCGQPATDRNFAGDGFCQEHLKSWREFLKGTHISIETAFRAWLKMERERLA